MELIKCGTKAFTVMGNIEGIITGINIRGERATYELSYFNNMEYKAIWLDVSEFETFSETTDIDFKVNFK